MGQQDGVGAGQEQEAALLTIAHQLRDVAVRAERADVAAKAEEAMALLRDGRESGSADVPERNGKDTGKTVERILNGLGF